MVLVALLRLLAISTVLAERCNVRDFGAVGDGATLDTASINKAISTARCTTVLLPAPGRYLSGTVRLKSHMVLVVEAGAAVLGAADGNYEHAEPRNPAANVCVNSSWAERMASGINGACQDYGHGHWADALLTGAHLVNVTLRGGGTIDGNGHLHESCVANNAEPPAASHVDPRGPGYTVGNASHHPGCKLFSLVNSSDISVTTLTFRRGGWFSFLFTDVERLYLADLEIEPSRDGIDLVGCRHVLAERLSVHGGNDDAFALKSDWSVGRRLDTFNVTLRHSTLSSTGCNCLQFGSETSGNFRDIHFENITCSEAGKAGIGISTNDGGNISDVAYRGITLTHTAVPISFGSGARAWQRRPRPWKVGRISNISFTNINAVNVSWNHEPWYWPHCQHCNATSTVDTIAIAAAPLACNKSGADPTPCYMRPTVADAQIVNVSMRNISIQMSGGGRKDAAAVNSNYTGPDLGPGPKTAAPSYGLFLRNLYRSTIDGLRLTFITNDDRPAVILQNCETVEFTGVIEMQRGVGTSYDVGLRNSSGISLPHHLRTCEYPHCLFSGALTLL